MILTRTKFNKFIRLITISVFLIIIIGYAILRSSPYFRGPDIKIFQPINGSVIASTTLTIIGQVFRVNSFTINSNPIQIDELGNFKETMIVFPGINIISFTVTDQFKRTVQKELRILGTQTF